ncbi:hypothetical protein CEXT_446721 [Caerostris extrusa]|uniref:Uncharacterized protein n=1 Tax=Caerostris extrusa TaxID=172846 RepID=A0AAV4RH72_CAEEX|nr:hypothetical protein CEXT_446721 [Caerostris extrusa]
MRISPFALNILLLKGARLFLLPNTFTLRATFKSRVHYDPGIKICNDNIPTSAGTEGIIHSHNFLSDHYLSSGIKVEELLVFPSNLPFPSPILKKI